MLTGSKFILSLNLVSGGRTASAMNVESLGKYSFIPKIGLLRIILSDQDFELP